LQTWSDVVISNTRTSGVRRKCRENNVDVQNALSTTYDTVQNDTDQTQKQ